MTAAAFGRSRLVRPLVGIELAAVVGFLDASVTIAYLSGINPVSWHAGTLFAKLLLAAFFRKRNNSVYWVPAIFVTTIILILTVEAPHIPSTDDYIQVIGFLVQFALTLFLIEPASMPKYARAGGKLIVAMAALHIVFCLMDAVGQSYGRYFYFGDSHPNLGGEIAAVGAFLAAYSFPKKRALLAIVVLASDCLFMQARAAVVVCAALLVVTAVFNDRKQIDSKRMLRVSIALVALGLAAVVLAESVSSTFSSALLLDDPNRGLGSGFSGRDDVWAFAVQLFEENPLFGTGFGYFVSIGYVGPHNIILFALAENGLSGLLVLGSIFYSAYVFSRQSWFNAALFASTLPLLMFNDRYLNLNPYPFMLYAVLMTLTMVPRRRPSELRLAYRLLLRPVGRRQTTSRPNGERR
jgi:O-antigen ligase